MGRPMAPRPTKPSCMGSPLVSGRRRRGGSHGRSTAASQPSGTLESELGHHGSVCVEVTPAGQGVEEEGGLGQCPVTRRAAATVHLLHRHVAADAARRTGPGAGPRRDRGCLAVDHADRLHHGVVGQVRALAGVGDVGRELAAGHR